MILQLENVHYRYPSKHHPVYAVRGITCCFETGKIYAVMGKSGCGKTTLLSLLGGLMLPSEGQVLVEGEATAALDCNRLRREKISLIYQNFNLFPLLTVEENVTYPLLIRKQKKAEAKATARRCLESVGITPPQFDRLPATLSGGEQQRVAIARTLASGNPIVLADEPTGNLDSANTQNIVEILRDLAHQENRCVIIVTHDHAVGEIADINMEMVDGQFLAESPRPEEPKAGYPLFNQFGIE